MKIRDSLMAHTAMGHVVWRAIRLVLSKLFLTVDEYPIISGDQELHPGKPTVLVCGHAAGKEIFGAERSFLDVLRGFSTLDFNVLIVIPLTINHKYLRSLRSLSHLVCIMPLRHRKAHIKPSLRIVRRLSRMIQDYQIHAVHSNTIMLCEPLLSARQCGIPGVVHVRESLNHDAEIRSHIGLSAEEIHRQVLKSADYIIANSIFTAQNFILQEKTYVVPNTVDIEELDIPNRVLPQKIEIGLISSNSPKKGIHEMVDLARRIATEAPQAHFRMIGPVNKYIRFIQQQLEQHPLPNLSFAGYASSPLVAMQQVNIVLNLSNCEETFGRTVLEAMAARRPVLVYDWGALPELVEDGVNGFIVPYRDIEVMVQKLVWLCRNPDKIIRMGEAGRKKAITGYGREQVVKHLSFAYSQILGGA